MLFRFFEDDVKTSTAFGSLTFNETENATLVCIVSGCPVPTVSWSKDGGSLNRFGNSLYLPLLVGKSSAGRYSCYAQNAHMNSSSQIDVTVNCEYHCIFLLLIEKAAVFNQETLLEILQFLLLLSMSYTYERASSES